MSLFKRVADLLNEGTTLDAMKKAMGGKFDEKKARAYFRKLSAKSKSDMKYTSALEALAKDIGIDPKNIMTSIDLEKAILNAVKGLNEEALEEAYKLPSNWKASKNFRHSEIHWDHVPQIKKMVDKMFGLQKKIEKIEDKEIMIPSSDFDWSKNSPEMEKMSVNMAKSYFYAGGPGGLLYDGDTPESKAKIKKFKKIIADANKEYKKYAKEGKALYLKIQQEAKKFEKDTGVPVILPLADDIDPKFLTKKGFDSMFESMSSNAANVAAGPNLDLQNPLNNPNIKRKKFNNCEVFEVDSEYYHKCTMGKQRYHRYEKYVGNDDTGEAIRYYGRKNPKQSIIVQDNKTQAMQYLRRV